MGHVLNAGCGQNTARQAALKAGLPLTTCCTTVNKVCASGMKSILLAAQQIKLGEADIVVAGGMESMSNVPLIMNRAPPIYGGFSHADGILKDGLEDPDTGRSMGDLCEDVAAEMGITREDQDNFAIQSYKRSAAAWDKEKGVLAKEIVEVKVTVGRGVEKIVKEDEEYTTINLEKMKTLRTVFRKVDGTITAANVSVQRHMLWREQVQKLRKWLKKLIRPFSFVCTGKYVERRCSCVRSDVRQRSREAQYQATGQTDQSRRGLRPTVQIRHRTSTGHQEVAGKRQTQERRHNGVRNKRGVQSGCGGQCETFKLAKR